MTNPKTVTTFKDSFNKDSGFTVVLTKKQENLIK